MLNTFLWSGLLLAISVVIHAVALTLLVRQASRWPRLASIGFVASLWQMVQIAWWIVLAHLAEIAVWGFFYAWREVFPDLVTATYFSIVTYTTVGYGDVIAGPDWRLIAGVEALTGILMGGWSAAFFFSFVSNRRAATLE